MMNTTTQHFSLQQIEKRMRATELSPSMYPVKQPRERLLMQRSSFVVSTRPQHSYIEANSLLKNNLGVFSPQKHHLEQLRPHTQILNQNKPMFSIKKMSEYRARRTGGNLDMEGDRGQKKLNLQAYWANFIHSQMAAKTHNKQKIGFKKQQPLHSHRYRGHYRSQERRTGKSGGLEVTGHQKGGEQQSFNLNNFIQSSIRRKRVQRFRQELTDRPIRHKRKSQEGNWPMVPWEKQVDTEQDNFMIH